MIYTLRVLWQYRRILFSTTIVELQKKHAGTVLGAIWLIVYPCLFLSVYIFLYLVVFQVRFPDMSSYGYVVLVFSGLVPYIALMECTATSTVAIRQNIHLVKNVMIPIELIPARIALMAMVGQLPGIAILLGLTHLNGSLSIEAGFLVFAMLAQFILLIGIAYMMAVLGGLFPDLQSFINVLLIFLLFVSPIAFPVEAAPENARLILQYNPVTHLIGLFRPLVLPNQALNVWDATLFVVCASIYALFAMSLFRRFKAYVIDHE